jgi:hypothetical protein
MYLQNLQKGINIKTTLKVTDERTGSGAGSVSGSDSQRNGSKEPDPYQNVTDPEQCRRHRFLCS